MKTDNHASNKTNCCVVIPVEIWSLLYSFLCNCVLKNDFVFKNKTTQKGSLASDREEKWKQAANATSQWHLVSSGLDKAVDSHMVNPRVNQWHLVQPLIFRAGPEIRQTGMAHSGFCGRLSSTELANCAQRSSHWAFCITALMFSLLQNISLYG